MGAGYPLAMRHDSETTELPGMLVARGHPRPADRTALAPVACA